MCKDCTRQADEQTGVTQIDVTPEMLRAGSDAYWDWYDRHTDVVGCTDVSEESIGLLVASLLESLVMTSAGGNAQQTHPAANSPNN